MKWKISASKKAFLPLLLLSELGQRERERERERCVKSGTISGETVQSAVTCQGLFALVRVRTRNRDKLQTVARDFVRLPIYFGAQVWQIFSGTHVTQDVHVG